MGVSVDGWLCCVVLGCVVLCCDVLCCVLCWDVLCCVVLGCVGVLSMCYGGVCSGTRER